MRAPRTRRRAAGAAEAGRGQARREPADPADAAETATVLTCPDCGGALWELDRDRATASGFTRYLIKPVDADDLVATLSELRGPEPMRASASPLDQG
jgi:hypothetical protein